MKKSKGYFTRCLSLLLIIKKVFHVEHFFMINTTF